MISIHIFSYDSEASNMSTLCEISAPKLPLSMVYFYYHIIILFVWIAEKKCAENHSSTPFRFLDIIKCAIQAPQKYTNPALFLPTLQRIITISQNMILKF